MSNVFLTTAKIPQKVECRIHLELQNDSIVLMCEDWAIARLTPGKPMALIGSLPIGEPDDFPFPVLTSGEYEICVIPESESESDREPF